MNQKRAGYLPDTEYDAIEGALLGSAKGQWFLRAYLERHQSEETRIMLKSVERLHSVLVGERGDHMEETRRELQSLLDDIRRNRCGHGANATAPAAKPILDHVEAQLLAITETLDDRVRFSRFLDVAYAAADSYDANAGGGSSKLFDELSAMVACAPYDAAKDL